MVRYRTHDQRAAGLERARRVAYLMDGAVRIPGTDVRVGFDPLLGVVPVSGDTVAALVSLYVVFEGLRVGLPARTLGAMLCWVALDFLVGSIPLVGPLFDARLRVNDRNARAIERYVDRRRQ
ncbi:DUF4112 domain-containing protein [Halomicroarcula sp. GCM10025817]|uniref:DUF4112 domain-containing protein n=1 Tax=Haloarcula TaxID=2237 RepID=UPI0023E8B3BD|nr:DUF4112 domain-containing protein [Halomicroarcula sp. SYNS111]